MTLRRAAAALPLALSVAVVAHVAGFGADHVPGGGHAAVLLFGLFAALAALAGWTFGAGYFGRPSRPSIATSATDGYLWATLTAGGALAFLAMEAIEGHLALAPGSLAALLALVPSALLVAICSRRLEASALRAGYDSARVCEALPRLSSSRAARGPVLAFSATSTYVARTTRGRAPPLPA